MEWQDVFSLILFLVLVTFSKKRKPVEEEEEAPLDEEPSFSNIDTVRKKIEALKRQRHEMPNGNIATQEKTVKKRPEFSAYKHLPKTETVAAAVAPKMISMMPVEEKPKDVMKSVDLPKKKSRLRDWVVGQVVLGAPAYRNYGNFIRR